MNPRRRRFNRMVRKWRERYRRCRVYDAKDLEVTVGGITFGAPCWVDLAYVEGPLLDELGDVLGIKRDAWGGLVA